MGAQIKNKYQMELKKNPARVMTSITEKRKPLTAEVYEKTYGKIDTSKHYKPPPSPLPGEAPEPDGSVKGGSAAGSTRGAKGDGSTAGASQNDSADEFGFGDDGGDEEDNNRTTERLMALFE